jgi:hypothetical protein
LQRRWQDGCRNLALVGSRLGVHPKCCTRGDFYHSMLVLSSAFPRNRQSGSVIPRSSPLASFAWRVKLTPDHVQKEQAPASQASARSGSAESYAARWRPRGWIAVRPGRSARSESAGSGGPGQPPDRTSSRPAGFSAPPPSPSRYSAGSSPVLQGRSAAHRDHGRTDARPPDRRLLFHPLVKPVARK